MDTANITGKAGLVARLGQLHDSRKKRGIRHSQISIITLAVCALLSGAKTIQAIAEWGLQLSDPMMKRLGCRWRPWDGKWISPSEPTIRRTLQRIDPNEVDQVVGSWVAGHEVDGDAVAVDGKALRGSGGPNRKPIHLVSALLHKERVVLAQQQVSDKTNEITAFQPLLKNLDLKGKVVTADAMHTQVKHAKFLKEKKGADYVFTVKENQPNLLENIKLLEPVDWSAPVVEVDKGHGRLETRQTQTSTSLKDYIDFPYAEQVVRIERHTTRLDGSFFRDDETSYAITSLSRQQADDRRIARLIRGHWSIENSLHWVRDVTFDEDRSTVRTKAAPRVMATLRNLVISVLRFTGVTNIAQAVRKMTWASASGAAFKLLGL